MPEPIDIEVFASGTHRDQNGVERTYTSADLSAIVDRYNNQPAEILHVAPGVIGHPKTDDHAHGWVDHLKVVGSKIIAQFSGMSDELATWLREKRLRTRSVAFYPAAAGEAPLLRHVGFLGAATPAVKGLADITFSGPVGLEFTDTQEGNPMTPEEIQALGAGIAEALKPQFDAILEAVKGDAAADDKGAAGTDTGGDAGAGQFAEKIVAQTSEIAQLKADNAKLQTEQKALAVKLQTAEFAEKLDAPDLKSRITPGMRPAILATMTALAAAPAVEYSEADGTKKSRTAVDDYLEQVKAAYPKLDESLFSEMANHGSAKDDTNELLERARSMARQGKPKETA